MACFVHPFPHAYSQRDETIMSDEKNGGLLYDLEQRIPPLPAFFSALQHVLAGLVGIITPPLIIGAALGLGSGCPI